MRAKEAKEKLWDVLDLCLKDRRQAWTLQSDGRYVRPGPCEGAGTHATLMEKARAAAGLGA